MKASTILGILFFAAFICMGYLFVHIMSGHGNGWYVLGFFIMLFASPGLLVYSIDLENKGK
jgi:hypothetical protein